MRRDGCRAFGTAQGRGIARKRPSFYKEFTECSFYIQYTGFIVTEVPAAKLPGRSGADGRKAPGVQLMQGAGKRSFRSAAARGRGVCADRIIVCGEKTQIVPAIFVELCDIYFRRNIM